MPLENHFLRAPFQKNLYGRRFLFLPLGKNIQYRFWRPKDEGRDEIVQRLSKASKEGKIGSKVWATPGLPMLIFVTVGLITALSLGDIVWILVGHIFG